MGVCIDARGVEDSRYHLGYSIGEWFLSYDELSFESLVNFIDEDCSDYWLL